MPALQEIQKEVRALATTRPAVPAEIEPAKTYLLGNFPLGLERFEQLTARMADIVALGDGEELWNGYYEPVRLVDAERVFEAAQKYLLPLPFVAVIVGDRASLSRPAGRARNLRRLRFQGPVPRHLDQGQERSPP